MASINIHGGDFVVGQRGTFESGVLTLPTPGVDSRSFCVRLFTPSVALFGDLDHPFFDEKIPLSKVMRVEAVKKEMNHRTGAAVGRGLVGAMIGGLVGAGPVGAIVGFTMTNHTSDVTFEAEFEGGRRLLATTNTATYTKLLAAAFDYKPQPAAR